MENNKLLINFFSIIRKGIDVNTFEDEVMRVTFC